MVSGGASLLVHRGAVGILAFVVYLGVVLLVAGGSSNRYLAMRRNSQPTSIQWIVAVLGGVICLAAVYGFDALLDALGYSSRRFGH